MCLLTAGGVQGGLRPSMSLAMPSMDVQTLDELAPSRKNITTLEGKGLALLHTPFGSYSWQ